MAHHHASPYHDVENVQMIASPLFKVPNAISPPYDMHALPDDITQRRYHDFSLEHKIVQEYQRIMAEEAAVMEAKESAYRLYSEERQARLKQERISRARKIAPGFLDNEDRRILTPTLVTGQANTSSSVNNQESSSSSKAARSIAFDFSEFEATDNTRVTDNDGQNNSKTELATEQQQQQQHYQQEDVQQAALSASPNQDFNNRMNGSEDAEEEIIIQAVPLSELTGMLRDSCLDDDSSSSAPRPWADRDMAPEVKKKYAFF
ncbi:hypothetical protein EDD21DRAFT_193332 [Dissophora ornata]|nr:hypothetical protein EDD21DRAFT_193332 [Dissophora ornata]